MSLMCTKLIITILLTLHHYEIGNAAGFHTFIVLLAHLSLFVVMVVTAKNEMDFRDCFSQPYIIGYSHVGQGHYQVTALSRWRGGGGERALNIIY